MVKYIGYQIKWGEKLSDGELEMYSISDWKYPDQMLERLKYIDNEILIFHFPNPLTWDEIEEYDENILNEELGYKLIKEIK